MQCTAFLVFGWELRGRDALRPRVVVFPARSNRPVSSRAQRDPPAARSRLALADCSYLLEQSRRRLTGIGPEPEDDPHVKSAHLEAPSDSSRCLRQQERRNNTSR